MLYSLWHGARQEPRDRRFGVGKHPLTYEFRPAVGNQDSVSRMSPQTSGGTTVSNTRTQLKTHKPATRRPVNAFLTGAAVALCAYQLFVLPWLPPVWGWTLVPLVLATTPFWSLIHEAIHGTLFADRGVNDRAGRVL